MGERHRVRGFASRDGESIELTHEGPLPDADFKQRMAELKEGLPSGEVLFARVRCDGCGTVADVDYCELVLPRGWAATDNGDFCPRCAAPLQ